MKMGQTHLILQNLVNFIFFMVAMIRVLTRKWQFGNAIQKISLDLVRTRYFNLKLEMELKVVTSYALTIGPSLQSITKTE